MYKRADLPMSYKKGVEVFTPQKANKWFASARLAIFMACSLGLVHLYLGKNVQYPWLVSPKTEYTTSISSGGHWHQPPIWTSCFNPPKDLANWLCTYIPVPLDHHNLSDERTWQIAVSMIPANPAVRKGAIFLNPGGPGGSGTASVQADRGAAMWKIMKGEYDIVGFDPRGINLTKPSISCFDNLAEQYIYNLAQPTALDIPANLSLMRPYDLENQLRHLRASVSSVAKKCKDSHGDYLKYIHTEHVVRDIEWMAVAMDGPNAKVNFWGFSYGTILGQYLVQILDPSRIGHVVIDGVVDPELWISYAIEEMADGLDDIDNVILSFASSCLEIGSEICPLASHFSDPHDLLAAVDSLIDSLYLQPQPSTSDKVPSRVYKSKHIREALFSTSYRVSGWKEFSENLETALFPKKEEEALKPLVEMVESGIPGNVSLAEATRQAGRSSFAGFAVICGDSRPYNKERPNPTVEEFASFLVDVLETFSTRVGDQFQLSTHCDLWNIDAQHRYPGPFGLTNGTLDLPILIFSQHYDPVTPLLHAHRALNRLGSNARLIEQVDGYGHCAIGQTSYCSAKIIQDYFTKDILPETSYTACKVNQKPFLSWNETIVVKEIQNELSAMEIIEDSEDMISLLNNWNIVGDGMVQRGLDRWM